MPNTCSITPTEGKQRLAAVRRLWERRHALCAEKVGEAIWRHGAEEVFRLYRQEERLGRQHARLVRRLQQLAATATRLRNLQRETDRNFLAIERGYRRAEEARNQERWRDEEQHLLWCDQFPTPSRLAYLSLRLPVTLHVIHQGMQRIADKLRWVKLAQEATQEAIRQEERALVRGERGHLLPTYQPTEAPDPQPTREPDPRLELLKSALRVHLTHLLSHAEADKGSVASEVTRLRQILQEEREQGKTYPVPSWEWSQHEERVALLESTIEQLEGSLQDWKSNRPNLPHALKSAESSARARLLTRGTYGHFREGLPEPLASQFAELAATTGMEELLLDQGMVYRRRREGTLSPLEQILRLQETDPTLTGERILRRQAITCADKLHSLLREKGEVFFSQLVAEDATLIGMEKALDAIENGERLRAFLQEVNPTVRAACSHLLAGGNAYQFRSLYRISPSKWEGMLRQAREVAANHYPEATSPPTRERINRVACWVAATYPPTQPVTCYGQPLRGEGREYRTLTTGQFAAFATEGYSVEVGA